MRGFGWFGPGTKWLASVRRNAGWLAGAINALNSRWNNCKSVTSTYAGVPAVVWSPGVIGDTLLADLNADAPLATMGARFHAAMAHATAEACAAAATTRAAPAEPLAPAAKRK